MKIRPNLTTLVIVAGLSAGSVTHAGEVAFIAVLKVVDENTQAFDALAEEMVAASAADDGLLVYEFARVGETVYGYERYLDAAAHARHETIIEPYLPKLMELAQFERIITLSQLSEDQQRLFEGIGAEIGQPIAGVAQDRPQ